MKKIRILFSLVILLIFPIRVDGALKATNFTLPNLKGDAVTLSSFQGKENVLLVFGATWCPPCRTEVPHLNELHAEFGSKGLKILNVNVGESKETVSKFAEKMDIQYEILLDQDMSVAKTYEVYGIPRNIFIDKEGNVQMDGFLDTDKIKKLMNQ